MSTISASTTSTTAYKVTADTTGALTFQSGSGPTTAMTIDSSQNVGIGVTPSAWATTQKAVEIGSLGSGVAVTYSGASVGNTNFLSNAYLNTSAAFIYGISAYAGRYKIGASDGQHQWFIAPSGTAGNPITFTQAMTLDSSGNLLVGTTDASNSISGTSGIKFFPAYSTTTSVVSCIGSATTSASSSYILYSSGAGAYRFYVDYGGTIHATATSIAAISDATLKTNVKDLETGLTEVMALKPRRFDWINGDATNVAGFIAQEVEQVLPELVVDSLYSQDEEGNEIYKKNLKMGDILPTLVKAIQEQQAIIQQLTARIETLEAK